jgi:competence protein ComFC
LKSIYLGDDENGRPRFETTRSEIGALLYQLKYQQKKSAVKKIVDLCKDLNGLAKHDLIVPIPATRKRAIQPVAAIADALGAELGIEVLSGSLLNSGDEELKGVDDPIAREKLLQKALSLNDSKYLAGKSVLLLDDLYRSGSTLRAATELIFRKGKAVRVDVLAITKTRSNR